MKFLLDNDLPVSTSSHLESHSHRAVHVGPIGLAQATDEQILEAARRNTQVVVTLDADFHTLLALAGATSPSVSRIRIEGLKAAAISIIVNTVSRDFKNELIAGAAITVDKRRIRCHMLPLR